MSEPLSPQQYEELYHLIRLLHDEQITEEQVARLEDWVCENEEVSEIYMQFMSMCAQLRWDRRRHDEDGGISPPEMPPTSRALVAPVLGSLRIGTQRVIDFFSGSFVLTLLLAIGFPGILFLILVLHLNQQPGAIAPVAKITDCHKWVWVDRDHSRPLGASLFPGERLRLKEGIAEITFDKGARVVLQGPAVFALSNANGGFLHAGSLVARVPDTAMGFEVRTPSVTVVDLGTEFGVRVEDKGRTADVHVFDGRVELAPGTKDDDPKRRRRMKVGQSVRVELTADGTAAVYREIPSAAQRFVRECPIAKSGRVVVADFTAGKTDLQVDGFPGKPGDGWRGPWLKKGFGRTPITTLYTSTTPRYHPLAAGAENYLGVVSTPTGLGKGGTIGRSYRDIIDVTKQHTIEFLMRIDEDLSPAGTFSNMHDQYLVLDHSGNEDLEGATASNHTWAIGLFGDRANQANAGGYWFFHNYVDGVENHVVTDMKAVTGTTYRVHVVLHPDERTYDVTVSDGTRSVTKQGMGWRNPTGDLSGLIEFCARGDSKTDDVRAFSIDSIRVTQPAKKNTTAE